MPPFLASLLKNSKALVALALVGIVVVSGLILFGKFNSAQKTMVRHENSLNAQYSDCQDNLSNYIAKIKEALGVADRASSALDTVLTDVVKGRYEAGSTANPSGGSAFSAIVEAYPDLNGITINYEKVQSAIFAGRDGFKNCNTMLLDKVRAYNTWRQSGLIQSKINAMVGAPSDNLEARVGDNVVYGKAALDAIKRLPLTSEAKDAYETGTMDPLDTNPTSAPSTTTETSPSAQPEVSVTETTVPQPGKPGKNKNK